MPGEFFNFSNQPFSTGFLPAQGAQVGGFGAFPSGQAQQFGGQFSQPAPGAPFGFDNFSSNYYIDRKGRTKRLESRESPDESIHLVQRRKSNTLKEKVSVGAPKDRASKTGSVTTKDTINSSSKLAKEAEKPKEEKKPEAPKDEKAEKPKEQADAKKAEAKSDANRGKSKEKKKHGHKLRREVFAEEYYVPGGPQYEAFDQYPVSYVQDSYAQPQFVGAQFVQQDAYQPVFGAGPIDIGLPGASYDSFVDLAGVQSYGPIGEPIPLGSIPIGPDAIVEPLVTIGPRTDLVAGQEVTTNSIHTVPVFQTGPVLSGVIEVAPAPVAIPQPVGPVYSQVEVLPQLGPIDNTGLPPGSKIIAEYILGYLDGKQEENLVIEEHWDKKPKDKKKEKRKKEPEIIKPHPDKPKPKPVTPLPDKPVTPKPEISTKLNETDLNKLKDDIISTIQKELNNLKFGGNGEPTIIKSDVPAIQPIFLMPKSEQTEQKPVYIPRNVYVPVIRPVFVPRERIIVRPQIIHVARPVLVDRPVPVQQKPIVIERDRPIPIRVETVEKVENVETTLINGGTNVQLSEQVIDVPYDYTKILEEADRRDKQQGANGSFTTYQYTTVDDKAYNYDTTDLNKYYNEANTQYISQSEYDRIIAEANRRDQEARTTSVTYSQANDTASNILRDVLALGQIESQEAQRKSEVQQLISEVERKKSDLQNSRSGIPSYTLEVFDSTVSDKFQRVEPGSIKNIYGYDNYNYLPTESIATQQSNVVYNPSDYAFPTASASYGVQPAGGSNSVFKTESFSADLRNSRTSLTNPNAANLVTTGITLSSSSANNNVFSGGSQSQLYAAAAPTYSTTAAAEATPVGTVTNVTQIPPAVSLSSLGSAPLVIQNVQKMIQNFGSGPYTIETTKSGSNL